MGTCGFKSRFRARKSANQTVAGPTTDLIIFDVEEYDGLGEFNPSTYRFTCKRSGYYDIKACVKIEAPNGTGSTGIEIQKNGVLAAHKHVNTSVANVVHSVDVSDNIKLTAGDYLEIYLTVLNAVSKTITGGTTYDSYFSAQRQS